MAKKEVFDQNGQKNYTLFEQQINMIFRHCSGDNEQNKISPGMITTTETGEKSQKILSEQKQTLSKKLYVKNRKYRQQNKKYCHIV